MKKSVWTSVLSPPYVPSKKEGRKSVGEQRFYPLGVALALAILGLAPLGFARLAAPVELAVGVGARAPKLEVGRWIKGKPVDKFEKGKVFVIESWATWCVPCIQSIPRLTELQKKYGDRVAVIGIDIWEENGALADPFVAKQGDRMDYSVAQDLVPPGGSFFEGRFAKSWIEGAGKYSVGIPLAFVVNGDGVIAWIGHPTELEGPLERIVSGTWDLAGARIAYEASMKEAMKSEPFKVAFYESERRNDWKAAASAAESLLKMDPEEFADWAGRGFAALYRDGKMPELAMSFAARAIHESYRSEPRVLAVLARGLARTGAAPNSQELNLAQEAAERSNQLVNGKKAFALAALAQVAYAKGEKDKALDLQRRALAVADGPDERQDMQTILDFLLGKK